MNALNKFKLTIEFTQPLSGTTKDDIRRQARDTNKKAYSIWDSFLKKQGVSLNQSDMWTDFNIDYNV